MAVSITSITPAIGPTSGGTDVVIAGSGFETSNVSFLCHCDGTNGSTTFTDSGPNSHTITANGDAQISTAQSKFGGASALFDGNGDYLDCGTPSSFDLGGGDFTIEFWLRFTGYSNAFSGFYAAAVIAKDTSGARSFSVKIAGSSTSYDVLIFNTGGSEIVVNQSFLLDRWYHVAICRHISTLRFFVDGVQVGGDKSYTSTITTTSTPLTIGGQNYTGVQFWLKGYLDDVRIIKGFAAYRDDFTLPSAALTNHVAVATIGGNACLSTIINSDTEVAAVTPPGTVGSKDVILYV